MLSCRWLPSQPDLQESHHAQHLLFFFSVAPLTLLTNCFHAQHAQAHTWSSWAPRCSSVRVSSVDLWPCGGADVWLDHGRRIAQQVLNASSVAVIFSTVPQCCLFGKVLKDPSVSTALSESDREIPNLFPMARNVLKLPLDVWNKVMAPS